MLHTLRITIAIFVTILASQIALASTTTACDLTKDFPPWRLFAEQGAAETATQALTVMRLSIQNTDPLSESVLLEASCLQSHFNSVVALMGRNPRRDVPLQVAISHHLFALHRATTTYNTLVAQYLNGHTLSKIFTIPRLRASWQRQRTAISEAQLAEYLSTASRARLSRDEQLIIAHFTPNIAAENPYATLHTLANLIATTPNIAARQVAAKAVAAALVRNGFKFSERGRKNAVRNSLIRSRTLAHEARVTSDSSKRKSALAAQKKLLHTIQWLKSQRFSLAHAFDNLQSLLNISEVDTPHKLIEDAKSFARSLFADEFVDRGMRLREGDFFLLINSNGPGVFFNNIANVANFGSHAGLIAADINSGFPYYFIAEVEDRFIERNITDTMNDVVIMRPRFPVRRGFTAEGLRNFHALGPMLFDTVMRDGMVNSRGRLTVYCSEFVNFMYKTNFVVDGPTRRSPFDGTNNTIPTINELQTENAWKIGYDFTSPFYIPESLLYGTMSKVVTIYTPTLRPLPNSSAGRIANLQDELHYAFGHRFAELMPNYSIREASAAQKQKYRLYGVARRAAQLFPALQARYPTTFGMLARLELPSIEQRPYFLHIFEMYTAFDAQLNSLSTEEANIDTTIGEFRQHFVDTILPQVDAMFANN